MNLLHLLFKQGLSLNTLKQFVKNYNFNGSQIVEIANVS